MFFEIEVTLSDRFKSLNPLVIRRTKATEIFLLVDRLNGYTKRKNAEYEAKRKAEGTTETIGNKTVIRRPAKDDWF